MRIQQLYDANAKKNNLFGANVLEINIESNFPNFPVGSNVEQ
jgi:hypothetical protein